MKKIMSPSSRRAWIEICAGIAALNRSVVALLAEGVDRNQMQSDTGTWIASRPPRGGRG